MPKNLPFPWTDLHSHLRYGSLGPHKSAPKWHLYRFSHFCRAHPCAQPTDRQTTVLVTTVAVGHIYTKQVTRVINMQFYAKIHTVLKLKYCTRIQTQWVSDWILCLWSMKVNIRHMPYSWCMSIAQVNQDTVNLSTQNRYNQSTSICCWFHADCSCHYGLYGSTSCSKIK